MRFRPYTSSERTSSRRQTNPERHTVFWPKPWNAPGGPASRRLSCAARNISLPSLRSAAFSARKPCDSATRFRRFESVIAKATRKTLDLKEMRDEYSEGLLKLAKKKHLHHKDVVGIHPSKKRPENVVDLMEVLKRSLDRSGKKSKQAA